MIDVVTADIIPLPECSRRVPNFFYNDNPPSKPKITQYDIFLPISPKILPSDDSRTKVITKA